MTSDADHAAADIAALKRRIKELEAKNTQLEKRMADLEKKFTAYGRGQIPRNQ